MRKLAFIAAAAAVALSAATAATTARAAGEVKEPADLSWQSDGPFGTYDYASVQRGLHVYRNVCSACHSLKRVHFRNLTEIGLSEEQAKAIAAEYQVTDGPNDDGEMFQRPGKLADAFPSPFPNDKAARAANGGALPPDLSLIIKAREDGKNYVHALLTGFQEPPAGVHVRPGMNYNPYFPGHQIAMPPPLSDDAVEYADGTQPTLDQEARDIVNFLSWAAEPTMEQRKRIGIKVVLFLLVFAGVLYAAKRKIWADVH